MYGQDCPNSGGPRKVKGKKSTQFQMKAGRRWIWRSPDGHTKNEIDYIMTGTPSMVTDVTVKNRINIGGDHSVVMGSIMLNTRAERRKLLNKNTRTRVDTQMIGTKNTFQLELKNRFRLKLHTRLLKLCKTAILSYTRLLNYTILLKLQTQGCSNYARLLKRHTTAILSYTRLLNYTILLKLHTQGCSNYARLLKLHTTAILSYTRLLNYTILLKLHTQGCSNYARLLKRHTTAILSYTRQLKLHKIAKTCT